MPYPKFTLEEARAMEPIERRKYLTRLVKDGFYESASIIDRVMTEIKEAHQQKLREVTDPRRMKFKQLKAKCEEYGIESKGVKQQLVDRIIEHEKMLEEKRKAEEHRKKLEEALAKKKKDAEEKRKRKIADRMKGKRKRKKKVKKQSMLDRMLGRKSEQQPSLSSSSSSSDEEDNIDDITQKIKTLGDNNEDGEDVLMPEEIEELKREKEEKERKIQMVKDTARDAAYVACCAARDAELEIPEVLKRISDLVTYVTIDWKRVKIFFSRFRTSEKSCWSLSIDVGDDVVDTHCDVCTDSPEFALSYVQMSLSEDVGEHHTCNVVVTLKLFDENKTLRGVAKIKLGRLEMLRLRRGRYVFRDVRFVEDDVHVVVDDDNDDDDDDESKNGVETKEEFVKDVEMKEESETSEENHTSTTMKPPGLDGLALEHTLSSGGAPSITWASSSSSSSNNNNNNKNDPAFAKDWAQLQKLRSRLGTSKMSKQKRFHEFEDAKIKYRDTPDEPKGRKRHRKRLAKQAQRRYKDANRHVEKLEVELKELRNVLMTRYPFRLGRLDPTSYISSSSSSDEEILEDIPLPPEDHDVESKKDSIIKIQVKDDIHVADDENQENKKEEEQNNNKKKEPIAEAFIIIVVSNVSLDGTALKRSEVLGTVTSRKDALVRCFDRVQDFTILGPSSQLESTLFAHSSPILDMDIIDLKRTRLNDEEDEENNNNNNTPATLSDIRVLTSSEDQTLKLWDLLTGTCTHTYKSRGDCDVKIESLFEFKSWEDEEELSKHPLDAVFEDEALEEAALKFQESEPIPGHVSAVKSCAIVPRVRTYYRELELRAKARLRRLAMSQRQRQGRKQQQKVSPLKKEPVRGTKVNHNRHPSQILRDQLIKNIIEARSSELENTVNEVKTMWSEMRDRLLNSIRDGKRDVSTKEAENLAKMRARHVWSQVEEDRIVERTSKRIRESHANKRKRILSGEDEVQCRIEDMRAFRMKRFEQASRHFNVKDPVALRTKIREALNKAFPVCDKEGIPIDNPSLNLTSSNSSNNNNNNTTRRRKRTSMIQSFRNSITSSRQHNNKILQRPSMMRSFRNSLTTKSFRNSLATASRKQPRLSVLKSFRNSITGHSSSPIENNTAPVVPLSRGQSTFLNETSIRRRPTVPISNELKKTLKTICGVDLEPLREKDVYQAFTPFDIGIHKREMETHDLVNWIVVSPDSMETYALSPSKDLQENRIFRTDRYLVSELNYHKNMSRVSTHARELFRHTHTGSPTRVGIESRVWTQLGDGEQYVRDTEAQLNIGGVAFRSFYTAVTLAAEDGDRNEAVSLSHTLTSQITPLIQQMNEHVSMLKTSSSSSSGGYHSSNQITHAENEFERCTRQLAAATRTLTSKKHKDNFTVERTILTKSDPEREYTESELLEQLSKNIKDGDPKLASRSAQYLAKCWEEARKKSDTETSLLWRGCVCVNNSNKYVAEIRKDDEKNHVMLSAVNVCTRELRKEKVVIEDNGRSSSSSSSSSSSYYHDIVVSILFNKEDKETKSVNNLRQQRRRTRRHRRSSAAFERRQSSSGHDLLDPKTCLASVLSQSPWLIAYGSEISTSNSLVHDLRESLNASALSGHVAVMTTVATNMSRVLPVARNLEHALEDGDPDAAGVLASQLASLSELLQIDTELILKKERERAQMLAKMDLEAMKETEVEIDPNEPRILSGGNDYNFKVWSQDTERVRHSVVSGDWPRYQNRGGVVHCIAVSHKADLVATADGDGRIRLYTLPDPELVHVFPSGPVKCVTFSVDDKYLYSGGTHADPVIKMWDVQWALRKYSPTMFILNDELDSKIEKGNKAHAITMNRWMSHSLSRDLYWKYRLHIQASSPGPKMCQAIEPFPFWWTQGTAKPHWIEHSIHHEYLMTYQKYKRSRHGIVRAKPRSKPLSKEERKKLLDEAYEIVLRERAEEEKERKRKEEEEKEKKRKKEEERIRKRELEREIKSKRVERRNEEAKERAKLDLDDDDDYEYEYYTDSSSSDDDDDGEYSNNVVREVEMVDVVKEKKKQNKNKEENKNQQNSSKSSFWKDAKRLTQAIVDLRPSFDRKFFERLKTRVEEARAHRKNMKAMKKRQRKRLRKKKAHEEKQKRKEQKRILREREKKRLKQLGEKIKKFTRERVTKNTSRNNRKSTQSVSLTAHMIEAFRELFDENDNKSHDEEGSMWCGCVASSSGYCSLIEHQLQGRAEREAEMHVTIARTKILTQLAKGRGPFVSDLESRLKRIEKDWNERNGKKVVDEKKEDRNKKNNNIDDNDDDGEEFLPDVARKEIVRVLTEEAVLKARLSAHERVIMARNHHLTRYDPERHNGLVMIFERQISREFQTLMHTDTVNRIAVSTDSCLLVSCGDDKLVKVWDPSTGLLIRDLVGHQGEVHCVDIAADSRGVVSASADATIRVWDALAGDVVQILHGHTDAVMRCRFLPGADVVVSAGFDGTLRVWRVSPEPPLPPSDIRFSDVHTDIDNHVSEFTLRWSQPNTRGVPVTKYHVVRRAVRKGKTNTEKRFGDIQTVTREQREIVVRDLIPGVTYQVVVACESAIGMGRFSEPVQYRMPPAKPLKPLKPRHVEASTTAILLQWIRPDMMGSNEIAYEIRYRGGRTSYFRDSPIVRVTPSKATARAEQYEAENDRDITIARIKRDAKEQYRRFKTSSGARVTEETLAKAKKRIMLAATREIKREMDRLAKSGWGDGSSYLLHEVSGLDSGTSYEFQVRAVNHVGESEWSPASFAKCTASDVPAKCDAPTLLRTIVTDDDKGGIEITWNRPNACGSMLTQYHITCVTVPGMECKIPASQNSYTFLPFPPGSENQFKIRAENFVGWGETSELSEVIRAPSLPPTPPLSVVAEHTKKCPTVLVLSWGEPENERGSDVCGYECAMRVFQGGVGEKFETFEEVEPDVGCLEVKGIKTETTVAFRVRAKNDAGYSDWSEISNKITTNPAIPPDKIKEINIEDLNPNGCKVSWSKVHEEHGAKVRKYHVYWYRSPVVCEGIMTKRERDAVKQANEAFPPNVWVKCVSVDAADDVRTIVLKNLNSMNRYHFKITSENDAGESKMSEMSEAVKPPTRMQYILMKREMKRKKTKEEG